MPSNGKSLKLADSGYRDQENISNDNSCDDVKKSVSQIIVTVYSSQTPVTTRKAPSDRDRGDIATVTAAVEISIKTINIPTPTPPPLTRSTGGRIRRVSGSVRFGCTRRRTLPSVSYFTRRMTFEMQGWGKLWLHGL